MIPRCHPLPLSGITLAVLDGTEPSKYRESLKISLEIARISSPDPHKRIAIVRETLHPDGKTTSFGMTARVLGMAKTTVTEHYIRYLAERRYGLRPRGPPHRLTRAIEEAITVKAIESFEDKMACTYSFLNRSG
jgi:hypothetical protein